MGDPLDFLNDPAVTGSRKPPVLPPPLPPSSKPITPEPALLVKFDAAMTALSRLPPIKRAMAWATIIWPVAMIGLALWVIFDEFGSAKFQPFDTVEIYRHRQLVNLMSTEKFYTQLVAKVAVTALPWPTIPYAIAMVILFVMWFATKDTGQPANREPDQSPGGRPQVQ